MDKIDNLDKKILSILSKNARIPFKDVAAECNVSRAAIHQRVQRLIDSGVSPERLMRFGLEYRHVTRFLLGQCTREELFRDLFTDIRRFAKRQMTWFRRMERNGVRIQWIDGALPLDGKAEFILTHLQ